MKEIETIEEVRENIKKEIDRNFCAKHYNLTSDEELAEIELFVQGGGIELSILDWDNERVCVIDYAFFWFEDDNASILTEIYKTCIILKELYTIMGSLVEVDFWEKTNYKEGSIQWYYYADKYEIQSIIYILDAYNKVNLRNKKLDKNFIKKNYKELYELLEIKSKESKSYFQQIIESEMYNRINSCRYGYRKINSELFGEDDFVYTIYNQKIYVGFTQEGIERYIEKYQLNFKEISTYYEGIDYCLMMENDNMYVWDKQLWIEAFNWIKLLGLDYGDIPVYVGYDKGRVLIRVVEFWVCITMETGNIERKVLNEKEKLRNLQILFYKNTKECIGIVDYDLFKLSPEEFENLCYDLLYEEGYDKIYKRGGVNTADGGVDIEATELVRGINTLEEKKWIFQCKRTKKIDRRDLNEIEFLLKEFEADRFGLFYVGNLNPKVLDRCKVFSKGCVWTFDQNWIKQKLREYKNIADKYFPIC